MPQDDILLPGRKSGIPHVPINLPTGGRFRAEGRTIRLERIHDDETVELLDLHSLGLLRVRDPNSGELAPPTLTWMRDAHRDGILHALDVPENASERQGRFALLDPDAAVDRDPKSTHRFSLANRALSDGIAMTDAACRTWLEANYGREMADLAFPRPGASSLRRWMSRLKKRGRHVGSLVSQVGRARGRSQLDAAADALVHEAALFFWTTRHVDQKGAYAWLVEQVDALNAKRPEGAPTLPKPSREAVRLRIHRLRCYDTVKAKYGKEEADRLFVGSGDAIVAVDLLEIGLMDATTLEQVVVFDDDWSLPACRVRITALMDVLSHAITGWHVYAGPNRAETSIETIIASMTAPEVPAKRLREHPMLGWMFGKYAKLLPDNEKALIGPSTLPSINECGIDVMPAPVEMPTAKASLERFFRTLKEALKEVPGTIIDPKRAKEMDMDAVDAACLTLPQLRTVVAQVVAAYNTHENRGLGQLSPLMVWEQNVHRLATRGFQDISRVRRVLGRTEMAVLTPDGVETNCIRYRDTSLVTALLDNMAHTEAVRGRRRDGTIAIDVKIRISPGNLDSIQVWDTLAEDWVVLPSTQPRYTQRLSEWEHREFRRMARRRNEPFASERDRLESRRETMRLIHEMAPHLPFQQRRNMAALYISEKTKRLAGSAAAAEPPVPLDEIAPQADQETMETARRDDGLPSSARKGSGRSTKGADRAPPFVDEGDADQGSDFDWDEVEALPPANPEIGHQPPHLDENWSEDDQ